MLQRDLVYTGTDRSTSMNHVMQRDELLASERIALAVMQILQPAGQELLALCLQLQDLWETNNMDAVVQNAISQELDIAGYSPQALASLAAAFQAILAAASIEMPGFGVTPRRAIVTLHQKGPTTA